MDTIADRLRSAVDAWGSVRAFQGQMAERNVPGTSTGAVYRYLNGEVEPPVSFLTAAAAVLGVSPHWLILGSEPGGPCSACAIRERRVQQAIQILSEA